MAKIICRCLQLDEETLKSKIKQGFNTFEMLKEETSVATGCGGCKKRVLKLLEELK